MSADIFSEDVVDVREREAERSVVSLCAHLTPYRLPPCDVRERAQCCVDRARIWKHGRHIGIQQHHVGSLGVVSGVLAANAAAKVVFR